jgi:signal transduction histidine kinase
MATPKKEIKKPSFIITYAVCLLVSLIVLGSFGAVLGLYAYNQYNYRAWDNMSSRHNDLTSEITHFLNTDKDNLTRDKIVWLKWVLVNHFTETGQCAEVYYDNELIADSQSTLILKYNVSSEDEQYGYKYYTLEIADNKYLEYFNTPEVNQYYYWYGSYERSFTNFEGLKSQPEIDFYCNEFYADLENCTFIPVEVSIAYGFMHLEPSIVMEMRITPDQEDIEGMTLYKCDIKDPDGDEAWGMKIGFNERPAETEFDVVRDPLADYDTNERYYRITPPYYRSFTEIHGYDVIKGIVIFYISALIVALIPATIRYNINKRNYEIFEYRRQTTNAMAHDLKTPIASIVAYTELLENNIDQANREHYLAKISEKAAQMNNIVNNILMFSRSENKAVPVSKSDVKTGDIINEIIAENEQQISKRNLKVLFDSESAPTLNTDPELFRRAVGNLINNAVLYSKEESDISISCDLTRLTITNVMAEPIEDISKFKEPFVKGSISRQNSGTGLGLAIAENDFAMLGYKLNIRTENGRFICIVDLR